MTNGMRAALHLDLWVRQRPVLHNLAGPELVPPVDDIHLQMAAPHLLDDAARASTWLNPASGGVFTASTTRYC